MDSGTASPELNDVLETLLWLGTSMMRAGSTAFETREWMEAMAAKMGLDAISVGFTLDSITASVRRGDERATMVREIGLPGVNAWRIRELEQLVKTIEPGARRARSEQSWRKSKPPRRSTPTSRLLQRSGWQAARLHSSMAVPRWK